MIKDGNKLFMVYLSVVGIVDSRKQRNIFIHSVHPTTHSCACLATGEEG